MLAFCSLVVVVTCSAGERQMQQSRHPGNLQTSWAPSTPAAPTSATEAPSGSVLALRDHPHSEAVTVHEPLAHFYADLKDLSLGKREEHVRIVWLGDSHTAADLWTHSVRRVLQAKFGAGGPGFFHIGLKRTRHSEIETDVVGSWQQVPGQPARTRPYDDGVFGLGGIRATAKQGAIFKARPRQGAVVGRAHYSIFYRLPAHASFELRVGDRQETIRATEGTDRQIQVRDFEAPADAELVIRQVSGMPEFFGAVLESSQPGLVLDTLGIDGARAKTPLAWDAAAWEREFERRSADLLVLAYGTNEVFERYAPERYAKDYEELLARARSVRPGLDCLMIGPTDVMEDFGRSNPRVAQISHVERAAAESLGCSYVGADQLMGGEGSYAEWQTSKPQLAGRDGVHLTVRGYQELGTLTLDFLLSKYQQPHQVSVR